VDFASGAYDWYPITQFGKPDPELLNQGLKRIDKFITELMNTYPIDPKRFFLMGFSQGSMISMSYLLTHPQRVAGVIAQSGYIPLENRFLINDVEVTGKPVIMTHGFEDSRMPLEWSLQTRDLLLHYGVDLEYHNFHMDHTITAESLQMIRGWLDRRI
jgi:phospholipase/carboxylesterase